MFTRFLRLLAAFCLFGAFHASAAVLYVNLNSANPASPFSSWATAATNIQNAVDAASTGDEVLVTNGIYQTGGRVLPGYALTNRLIINDGIIVQSVNGPAVTVIQGYQDTNSIVGDDAVRCVYLMSNAILSGFTLTNGATRAAGDNNLEQSGGGVWCESSSSLVTNCVMAGNAANYSGGGANQGAFIQCIFAGNAAGTYGGGANNCLLNNCTLTNNLAGSVLPPAVAVPAGQEPRPLFVVSNFGGGAEGCTLNNCILSGNGAEDGGGLDSSTANNCLLLDNSANFAGGADNSTLNNCTLAGNIAWNYGGAAYFGTLNNCISYNNDNGDTAYSTVNYSCLASDPGGIGNITNNPLFVNASAGDFHLQPASPCVNAGNNVLVTTTTDLAGNPRISGRTVDMGAYELQLHSQLHYVNVASADPVPPFSSWATAATNIQDAVDVASNYDAVLVTDGTYQTGGRTLPGSALTNRLVVTNAVTVQSVNGPLVTTIAGYQIPGDITGDSAVRCAYLANGAALNGFTITQGSTLAGGNDVEAGGDTSGAGILCPLGDPSTASDCIFVSNIAGDFGGGIYGGTLYNCLVVSNNALLGSYGGGTFGGNYYNCTITANSAAIGAGDAFGNLMNCIVYGNDFDGGNYAFSTLNYCCTTPDPGGTGNVISSPLFIDAFVGNFYLQAASPCVNAGNNPLVTTTTDLANNPRISGGTVDIGAYELQFHYVDAAGINPVAPFSSWATAATNIQDAVDAASNYDEVLVTNGTYQFGGRTFPGLQLTNRLIVTNAITVESVNGPFVTVIQGYRLPSISMFGGAGSSAVRCAALANRATLIGFTLTGGATLQTGGVLDTSGGGLISIPSTPALFSGHNSVSDCVITHNIAERYGGGAYCAGQEITDGGYGNILNNCIISNNVCEYIGGGLMGGSGTTCLIVANEAIAGGGSVESQLFGCTIVSNTPDGYEDGFPGAPLYNCILYYNGSNYEQPLTMYNCCTTPLPSGGFGNITNNPLFVNPAVGDFHLQSNSPCINAGNNGYVSIFLADLDGNPRVSGGTVDVGAYEFQNPASIISYAWLEQYGFPTDGSADFLDSDHDGMNNWQEWIAGTDPTSPSSVLQMLAPTPSGTNIVITWQSVTNQTYLLLRAQDPQAPLYNLLANVPGQVGTTSYTDTNAPSPGPYFYRVVVVAPSPGPQSPLPWPPIPVPPPLPQIGH